MTGELGNYLERHHQDTIRRVANPGTEWLDPATVDELVTWGFLRARTAADRLPPGGRAYGYVLTDIGRQYAVTNGLTHADTPWTSVAPAERKPDPVWDRIASMPSEELRERVAQAAAEAQATLDEHAHVFDDTVSVEAMHRPVCGPRDRGGAIRPAPDTLRDAAATLLDAAAAYRTAFEADIGARPVIWLRDTNDSAVILGEWGYAARLVKAACDGDIGPEHVFQRGQVPKGAESDIADGDEMECPGCGRVLPETTGQEWSVTDGDPLGCGCDGCWSADGEEAHPMHDDRCLQCAQDEIDDLRAELARATESGSVAGPTLPGLPPGWEYRWGMRGGLPVCLGIAGRRVIARSVEEAWQIARDAAATEEKPEGDGG